MEQIVGVNIIFLLCILTYNEFSGQKYVFHCWKEWRIRWEFRALDWYVFFVSKVNNKVECLADGAGNSLTHLHLSLFTVMF
jgi:hypothetical protein